MKPNWTPIRIKLGQIQTWEPNPRMSTKAQAQRLIDSERKFGQPLPFLVEPPSKNGLYPLLDGHQRLAAWLTVYGADYEVDAMMANRPLTDKEHRELVVTLHTGATGSWDWDILSSWDVSELREWGMDESALKEWNNDALNLREMLMAEDGNTEEADAEPQFDRAEELREKWGTARGQVWRLGKHRVMCGDCTDAGDVARLMDGKKARCCVTDPPYGINRAGITNDDPEGLFTLYNSALDNMPVTDGVLVAFQSPRLEWIWLDASRKHGWQPERLLWMYKPNDETFPWRGWLMTSEAIRISTKGKAKWIDVHPYSHDCYSPTTLGKELFDGQGWHPSVKPLGVIIDIVRRIDGIVFDPFCGSGTMLIACENLGRVCYAMEIEPKYVAVSIQRWVDATGGTPELIDE